MKSFIGIEYSHSVKWSKESLQRVIRLMGEKKPTKHQEVLLSAIRRLNLEELAKIKQQIQSVRNNASDASIKQAIQKTYSTNSVNYLLLKPVSDGCNLRCSYCYEGPEEIRKKFKRMDLGNVKRIVEEFCEQGIGKVGFSFHGGEPLLAGLDFFKYTISLQEKYLKQGLVIENTVQTNGTLIDSEWAKFFREYNFTVGTSLDGLPDIHDKYRVFANGKGSYNAVIEGIRKLQAENINYGVISVITNEHAGRAQEHFRNFMNLGILDFALTPAFGIINDIDVGTVEPNVFSDYVIDLFEEWLESGRTDVNIRIVQDTLKGFLGQKLSICSLGGTCTKIIAVEPNGEVKSCTRSCGESEKQFGNILQEGLLGILDGNTYREFRLNETIGQETSKHCRWFEICHNGCSANRLQNGKVNITGKGKFCDCEALPGEEKGYPAIYQHILNRTNEILNINNE